MLTEILLNKIEKITSTTEFNAALWTAALAIVAKLVQDSLARKEEIASVSSAVLGEIMGYLSNFDYSLFSKLFRDLSMKEDQISFNEAFKSISPLPQGHPIFDKLSSNQIGMLPSFVARDISQFYNFVTCIRLSLPYFGTQGFRETSLDSKKALFKFHADKLDEFAPKIGLLVHRLHILEKQSYVMYYVRCLLLFLGLKCYKSPRKERFNLITL